MWLPGESWWHLWEIHRITAGLWRCQLFFLFLRNWRRQHHMLILPPPRSWLWKSEMSTGPLMLACKLTLSGRGKGRECTQNPGGLFSQVLFIFQLAGFSSCQWTGKWTHSSFNFKTRSFEPSLVTLLRIYYVKSNEFTNIRILWPANTVKPNLTWFRLTYLVCLWMTRKSWNIKKICGVPLFTMLNV